MTWFMEIFFKDLTKRTVSDKTLLDKASNIAKNLKYDGYQMSLVSMVYKFFDKKTAGGVLRLQMNLLLKMKIFQIKI